MKTPSAPAKPFELDLRSLAAFRIALATMLLFDLAVRFPDIGAFLTDGGVLPREAIKQSFPASVDFSLHLMTGTWIGQALLLGLHSAFALMLLVGYRTRVATIVCWTLLVSLQSRNDMVLHGGDHYLKVLFLWAMFLPLDGAWSVDKPAARKKSVSSLATFILLVQMGVVYWFAAALKTGPEWVTERSALYYALSISYFKMPLGQLMLGYPSFLRLLTQASLWLEWLGPLGFFIPIRFTRARVAVFATFFLFHLGIGASLYLGSLPYVFLIPLFVLLPPPVWTAVEPWAKRRVKIARHYLGAVRAATEPWWRAAARALPGFGLALLGLHQLTVNFETLAKKQYLPDALRGVTQTLRLEQDWGMFAPHPYKAHGWYVIEAVDGNGNSVPVVDREPASTDDKTRPAGTSLYANGHWLTYSIIASTDHAEQLGNYAAYLCRKEPRAAEVRLAFMRLVTPPVPDVVKPSRVPLLTHRCGRATTTPEDVHAR